MNGATVVAGLELAGSYRLTRQLGKGGMGEVWEAEHLRLPKHVAVKFLLVEGQAQPELLSRFQREAEIASQLKHPHIIEVHDYNVLPDGTPFIVMECLQGQDLRARMEQGPIAIEEAQTITRQIASALSLAHKIGVIHRDLKPENIFLCATADGSTHAKVLDFGISKLRDRSGTFATQEHSLLGTPGYMSPEQAMGKHASLDGRADLFSLGTIVYEMLSGGSVWSGESLAEVVYKVVHHTPPSLRELSTSVPVTMSEAVAQALEKDPDARQPSVEAFVAALHAPVRRNEVADTLLASASPVAMAEPSAPPRSHRPGVVVSVVGGGALAVALYLSWTQLNPGPTPAAAPGANARPPGAPARAGQVADPTPTQGAIDGQPTLRPQAPALTAAAGPAPAPTPINDVNDMKSTDDSLPGPASPEPGPASPEPEPEPKRSAQPKAHKANPEVARMLGQAQRALEAGKLERAIQLARNTLRIHRTSRAFEIMVSAYCSRRDVGMTQAMLRNLSGSKRRKARRACQDKGLGL